MSLDALLTVFEKTPRQGPGNTGLTRRALAAVPELQPDALVLDLGCGSGAQTLVLARELPQVRQIFAVDIHQPFLDTLDQAAAQAGLAGRIQTVRQDFCQMGLDPDSVDLIWAEGAIFILGFAQGLIEWSKLLKPGGVLLVSDLAWLTEQPSAEAEAFWSGAYPGMLGSASQAATLAEVMGLNVLESFVFPAADWGPDFHGPLEARVRELRPAAAGDSELTEVLDKIQTEIEISRRYGQEFGYVYLVLQKD